MEVRLRQRPHGTRGLASSDALSEPCADPVPQYSFVVIGIYPADQSQTFRTLIFTMLCMLMINNISSIAKYRRDSIQTRPARSRSARLTLSFASILLPLLIPATNCFPIVLLNCSA